MLTWNPGSSPVLKLLFCSSWALISHSCWKAEVLECPAACVKLWGDCWPLSAVGEPPLKTHLVLLMTDNRYIHWCQTVPASCLQSFKPSSSSLRLVAVLSPRCCWGRSVGTLWPTAAVFSAAVVDTLPPKEATEGFFEWHKWPRNDWENVWIRNTLIPRGNWVKIRGKSDTNAWTMLYAVTVDEKRNRDRVQPLLMLLFINTEAACSDAQCGRRNYHFNQPQQHYFTLGLESYPYASLRSRQVLPFFFLVCVLLLQCLSWRSLSIIQASELTVTHRCDNMSF